MRVRITKYNNAQLESRLEHMPDNLNKKSFELSMVIRENSDAIKVETVHTS